MWYRRLTIVISNNFDYRHCQLIHLFNHLFTVIITVINCFSVRIATGLQNVLTIAKLAAIVVITFGGFVMMGFGKT